MLGWSEHGSQSIVRIKCGSGPFRVGGSHTIYPSLPYPNLSYPTLPYLALRYNTVPYPGSCPRRRSSALGTCQLEDEKVRSCKDSWLEGLGRARIGRRPSLTNATLPRARDLLSLSLDLSLSLAPSLAPPARSTVRIK